MAIDKIENRKQLLVNLHSQIKDRKPLDSDGMPLIVNGEIAVQNADGKLFIVDETGSGLTEFVNAATVAEMITVSAGSSSAITVLSGAVEELASAVTILNGDEDVEGSVANQVKEGVIEAENFTETSLGDRFIMSGGVITPTVSDELDKIDSAITEVSGAVEAVEDKLDNKVEKVITSTTGTARIFNEVDGGGAKFEHSDGSESFVGVNNGGEEGLMAQIYADKLNEEGKWEGAKIDVTNGGIYYTVGDKSFAERAVPENEIATMGDLEAIASGSVASAISMSEVSVEKLEEAESGYAATYVIKQNGEQVGSSINIPKDFLVKSAEIKVCEVEDEPIAGLKPGDKYIDFTVNSKDGEGEESHIYLNVKDLCDVYTGDGETIEISSGNVISLKASFSGAMAEEIIEEVVGDKEAETTTGYTIADVKRALEAAKTALGQDIADEATARAEADAALLGDSAATSTTGYTIADVKRALEAAKTALAVTAGSDHIVVTSAETGTTIDLSEGDKEVITNALVGITEGADSGVEINEGNTLNFSKISINCGEF